MKEIKLTKGYFAQVDDSDFNWLNQFKWNCKKRYYKSGNLKLYAGTTIKGKYISMHRLIMGPPSDMQIDHRDHNGLNCQRYNMRICTNIQNRANRTPGGLSKYLGVSPYVKNGRTYYRADFRHKYVGIL